MNKLEGCKPNVKDKLPTEMTIEGRTYDILDLLLKGESGLRLADHAIVHHARNMSTDLGQDDIQHILNHRDQIPVSLQGEVVFVLFKRRPLDTTIDVVFLSWSGSRHEWILRRRRDYLEVCWLADLRVLRPK